MPAAADSDILESAESFATGDVLTWFQELFGISSSVFQNGANIGATATPIIEVAKLFNILAVVVMSVLLSYAVLQFLLRRAGDGNAKRGVSENLWTGVGAAFSIGLLAPILPGSLSLSQAVVVSVAGVGSAVADRLAVTIGERVISDPAGVTGTVDSRAIAQRMFYGQVCALGFAKDHITATATRAVPFTPVQNGVLFGEDGRCGSMMSPALSADSTTIQQSLANAVVAANQRLFSALQPIATAIVFHEDVNPDIRYSPLDVPFYNSYIEQYNSAVAEHTQYLKDATRTIIDTNRAMVSPHFTQELTEKGWIAMASWYREINRFNTSSAGVGAMANASVEFRQPVLRDGEQTMMPETHYDNTQAGDIYGVDPALRFAKDWLASAYGSLPETAARAASPSTGGASGNTQNYTSINDILVSACSPWKGCADESVIISAISSFVNWMVIGEPLEEYQRDGDPVRLAANIGANTVDLSQMLYGLSATGSMATSIPFVGKVVESLIEKLNVIIGLLYAGGIYLSVILPSMPMYIYTMLSVGWIISVVVGVIAAPIAVALFAVPGSRGLITEYTQPFLALLINVLALPVLMVIGLVASIFVSKIGLGLWTMLYLGSAGFDYGSDLLRTIAHIGFFIFGASAVLMSSFYLISKVPNRFLELVSPRSAEHSRNTGATSSTQAVSGQTASATTNIAAVATRGSSSTGSAVGSGARDALARRTANKSTTGVNH